MVATDKGLKLTLRGELLYTESELRRTRAESMALGMMLGIFGTALVGMLLAVAFGTL